MPHVRCRTKHSMSYVRRCRTLLGNSWILVRVTVTMHGHSMLQFSKGDNYGKKNLVYSREVTLFEFFFLLFFFVSSINIFVKLYRICKITLNSIAKTKQLASNMYLS
uniref:Uncharacterized protein n=1 Tax=Octopus bimaculoides TaxID=37653 RepID=A0A0L8HGR5_OCTBM